jgi:hypothetical protein
MYVIQCLVYDLCTMYWCNVVDVRTAGSASYHNCMSVPSH